MFVSFVIFNLAEIKENMIFFVKPDDRQTKRVLSYKFLTFPRASLNIAKADLFKAIQRSFDVNLISECSIQIFSKSKYVLLFQRWSDVANITFYRDDNASNPDVSIGFYSGKHPDCPAADAFDGPHGTLGHSTLSHVHFDDDEAWTTNDNCK